MVTDPAQRRRPADKQGVWKPDFGSLALCVVALALLLPYRGNSGGSGPQSTEVVYRTSEVGLAVLHGIG